MEIIIKSDSGFQSELSTESNTEKSDSDIFNCKLVCMGTVIAWLRGNKIKLPRTRGTAIIYALDPEL